MFLTNFPTLKFSLLYPLLNLNAKTLTIRHDSFQIFKSLTRNHSYFIVRSFPGYTHWSFHIKCYLFPEWIRTVLSFRNTKNRFKVATEKCSS